MINLTLKKHKGDILQIGCSCLEFLEGKKAINPVLLDLREISSYLDFFIIITGNSQIHCRALARDLAEFLNRDNIKLYGKPDFNSEWIIMDFGDLIVHVFTEEVRSYYKLEKLWADSVSYFPGGCGEGNG